MDFFKKQRGVALFLMLVIMSSVFVIGITVTGLLMEEVRTSREIGQFIPAIYAADAGVERALYKARKGTGFGEDDCVSQNSCLIGSSDSPETLGNGAKYFVVVRNVPVANCPGDNKCITSTGRLKGTSRALRASY